MPYYFQRPLRTRLALFVIDESPLWLWVSVFLGIIIVFGIAYALLSPSGNGMYEQSSIVDDVNVLQGIYFSIVTISSLGYGDIQPIGVAKVLAGLEVVLGLAVIGVMIARLTSKPLTHLVSRLFVSETKRQMEDFRALFDARRSDFEFLLEEVNRVYQQTPAQTPGQPAVLKPSGSSSHPPATPDLVSRSLRTSLDRLFQASRELHDYIHEEGLHRSYFVLAPTTNFLQLAEAVERAYFFLGQSIVSLPVESTPSILRDVLTHPTRKAIDRVLTKQKDTCRMVVSGVRIDEKVQSAFQVILRLCDNISASLLPVREQPDQLISTS